MSVHSKLVLKSLQTVWSGLIMTQISEKDCPAAICWEIHPEQDDLIMSWYEPASIQSMFSEFADWTEVDLRLLKITSQLTLASLSSSNWWSTTLYWACWVTSHLVLHHHHHRGTITQHNTITKTNTNTKKNQTGQKGIYDFLGYFKDKPPPTPPSRPWNCLTHALSALSWSPIMCTVN